MEIGLLTFQNGGIFLDSYVFIVERAPFWIVLAMRKMAFSVEDPGFSHDKAWKWPGLITEVVNATL